MKLIFKCNNQRSKIINNSQRKKQIINLNQIQSKQASKTYNKNNLLSSNNKIQNLKINQMKINNKKKMQKQNNLLLKVRKIKKKYRSIKKYFHHKKKNKIKKLMTKRKISRSNVLMNLTQKINKRQ